MVFWLNSYDYTCKPDELRIVFWFDNKERSYAKTPLPLLGLLVTPGSRLQIITSKEDYVC
jgi:hypothetical protein